MSVKLGLERLLDEERARIKGRSIGLVAHPASVDRSLRHALPLIQNSGAELVALFGPEHGIFGDAQDMAAVEGGDPLGGVRVHSLYGERYEDLTPRAEWLRDLDAIVIDLQDVGSRYYTFIWTAALVMIAAAREGVETIILDRPNPLGGEIVEGRPLDEAYRSFVGLYPIATRHGMTIGEIAQMVRRVERLDEEALHVVKMEGYRRSMRFEETGAAWVLPSPNMPTLDTAFVYPGGCLIEGTKLSEGRGTTRPFELFGGPGLDAERVAAALSIEGAKLRPLAFRPTFQKHAGALIPGFQLHVLDRDRFRSHEAYLRILTECLSSLPPEARYREEEYEYVSDRPAIDLLTGSAEFRVIVDRVGDGDASARDDLEAYLEREREGAERFKTEREQDLLY